MQKKYPELNVPKPRGCMEKCLIQTLEALAHMSEIHDPYTASHQKRVANLSMAIARGIGFKGRDILGIYLGAVIHDIGKIKVPAEILAYPGKLTREQFELIKKHPEDGYEIIKNIDFPWPIKDIVLLHHERLDGSGYPFGLKAKEIPVVTKIVSVADVVESMMSHRPYRPSLGVSKALDEITRYRGSLFDSEVVDVCIDIYKKNRLRFLKITKKT
ncbi:HD-GYP domain-containing protein [Legionella londiniensis]|uniref:Metal dependent phosphohydrolase n=1 Tax=Legionella londiniensis TaxID=45068 RepID=A0A0W0VN33_9GAMM|nr:HD-GYP domain-containing protein [Legionella londiniensis]KTD21222.1 metal dependent phosphohydrolase [Legionella londiniensis]STX93247.1 metal dependent phosphohydrolase [Legionella londiniensis]